MVKEVFPTYDLIGIAHKVFQKPEFFQGERNVLPLSHHASCGRIKFDLVAREYRRRGFAWPPQKRPQAGREFGEGERLYEVIVGTREKKLYFRIGLCPRGENKDRHCDVPRAHFLAYLIAVHRRKHEIKDDEVIIRAMQ